MQANGYPEEYFAQRLGNDPKRQAAFRREAVLVKYYIKTGRLLDVGCSTGEFLEVLQWPGESYGMELSDYARQIAQRKGICFDRDLLNSQDWFDLIIFRGTIQHVDTPMLYLKLSFRALRPGGYLIFLMTPNADSICYRLFRTLPMLEPTRNFYVPSATTLPQALINFGFKVVLKQFPYWETPYAQPLRDHLKFLLRLLGIKTKFAFWGNAMELVAQKPLTVH